VQSIDYHGADSILECLVGDQLLQVRVEGVRRPAVGEPVGLEWKPEAMHVFDRETTLRVERKVLVAADGAGEAPALRAVK
jgi:sn-glycerol 3-phosphate transport system ATP-binding protein